MRKLICSIFFLFVLLTVQAAPIKGLRIESTGQPVIVCVNNEQVCTASTSCFVANLSSGLYKVDVYAVVSGRRGEAYGRGELLYSQQVHYLGGSVLDIRVNTASEIHPERGRGEFFPDVMNDEVFNRFFTSFKKKDFDSERIQLLEQALGASYFTSDQCRRIVGYYTFDSERMKIMKMMYPKIADKNTFFLVVDMLDFSTNKSDMDKFIKQYTNRN